MIAKRISYLILLYSLLVFSGYAPKQFSFMAPYESEHLQVTQLTKSTFMHTSFLETKSSGKVPCNGMLVLHKKQLIVFDTPVDDVASAELIDWVENNLGARVTAVLSTHFHVDCLGGLGEFHRREVPSYASYLSIELAEANGSEVPKEPFDGVMTFFLGKKEIQCRFFGEGHTKDNVVVYFPQEEVLFSGCLVKANGGNKGYLGDANVEEWSKSVSKVRAAYPNVKKVIPGHGKPGGAELLDFTIDLFRLD